MDTGNSADIEEERHPLYLAMSRAREYLHVMQPYWFYVTQQRTSGDRHLYALRTRFITGKPINPALFPSATTIEKIAPVEWNDVLKRATCQAVLLVEASAGIDRTVDEAIQVTFARYPDALLMLPISFSGQQDKRRYNVPIFYTSQSTNGSGIYASVGRPSELESSMTFGLLKAL